MNLACAGDRIPAGRQESAREVLEGLAGDAEEAPLVERLRAEGLVEADGRFVPVQNGPLEAPAAALDRDSGDGLEQLASVSPATRVREYEEIFEVHPRLRQKGRVVVEEERKADDSRAAAPAVLGHQRFAVASTAEQVQSELLWGSDVRVFQLLVPCELVNEGV